MLHAEQGGRSFSWLLTRPMAERLSDDLRDRGWNVEIQEGDDPETERDRD